jgi:hypothetical protein
VKVLKIGQHKQKGKREKTKGGKKATGKGQGIKN